MDGVWCREHFGMFYGATREWIRYGDEPSMRLDDASTLPDLCLDMVVAPDDVAP